MPLIRLIVLVILCATSGCRAIAPSARQVRQQQPSRHNSIAATPTEIHSIRPVSFHQVAESEQMGPAVTAAEIETVIDEQVGQVISSQIPFEYLDAAVVDLDHCIEVAMSISPAISEIQSEIGALRGKHLQAGLPVNPTVGINGSDINENGAAGRYGFFYGNTIIRGDKQRLSQNIVCNEIRQKEIELVELRQRLRTDVKQAYYAILVANEKYKLTDQLVELSRDAVEATQGLLAAKEIARTSLIQAELEMQNALIQKQRANNELAGTRERLAVLLGQTELHFGSFAGELVETDPLIIENQFDNLLALSPEIARIHARVAMARSNLTRQQVEPIGNVTWQTSVAYDFASDDVVTGFQIGLPVPKFNQNQGAIGQARHEVAAAEAGVEKRTLQLKQKLVQTYQAYRDAKIQVESYEANVLPKAKETLELVTEGFQQGEVDFLQLLTAQRTFFQSNLAVIEQQGVMWRHRIDMEGLLLSGSLESR